MIRGIIKTDWEKYGLSGTERAEEINPKIFLEIANQIDVNLLK